ncbi:MAG TPA: thiamine pyrophosphate-dependent enzyme [Bacteroidales bacterium]|nr:thiamine pyrophosphate-dependent enzyme [Bacteroidales bacterium]
MQKVLLLGDEAIAQAGIDAGMSGIFSYPGTPSTEITEFVRNSKEAHKIGIVAAWCANEKTAAEAALGMSYAGKRAMTCMKHVGLNVAADIFLNSAITGANGGILFVVADDPSMHSSQNEQDSRIYGKFAMVPVLEPSNQQEAYDMVHYGFDLSEKYKIPVMIRITTRLAHSRAGVVRKLMRNQNQLCLPQDRTQFVLLPSIARKQYNKLVGNQPAFQEEAQLSVFNTYISGKDRSMGIIACGLAYNYLMENFSDRIVPYPVVKVAQYPLPEGHIRRIYEECDSLLVLEEGYPVVEEMLKGFLGLGKPVKGRLDGTLVRTGELNPNEVASGLGMAIPDQNLLPSIVEARPPSLCRGCSHIDSFNALNEVLEIYGKGRVFSDIGCYTLSALPPFESINSCVDMGASITMAKGAADAGLKPAIAVLGDSTFTHSGMTGLLDAVNDKSNITVIILDNETTGMTGGQPSSALGKIEDICRGLGVEDEHIRVLKPLHNQHEENVKILKEEIEYNGVSVIIPRRECIQTLNKKMRLKFKEKTMVKGN